MAAALVAEPVREVQPELFVSADVSEEMAAAFYLLLYNDGLLPSIFYKSVPTLTEFLGWRQRSNCLMIAGFVQRLDGPRETAGMGFLWDVDGIPGCMRADLGLVFLRKFLGHATTIPLANLMLNYCFSQGIVDVVYGVSAVECRAAIALAKALGFEQTQELPMYGSYQNKPSSAILSWLTAERFYQLQRGKTP